MKTEYLLKQQNYSHMLHYSNFLCNINCCSTLTCSPSVTDLILLTKSAALSCSFSQYTTCIETEFRRWKLHGVEVSLDSSLFAD
jgi:hypothetical protein